MSKKIYFDLDGTVYDLYGCSDWLGKLRAENETVFAEGRPLFTDNFYKLIAQLAVKGFQFGVITWLPMQASPEYEEKCRAIKIEWCKKYMPFISTFVAQSYGVPKQNAIKSRTKWDILIDDNAEVCEMWATAKTRESFQLTDNFTVEKALENILEIVEGK